MNLRGRIPVRDRTRRFVPRLESLEDRCCPSSLAVHCGTLLVRGDNGANQIAITDDGKGNVSATVDGQTVSGTGIKHVVVDTRNGDDTVTYTLTGQLTTDEQLQFQLGKGNDQLTLDVSKGVSAARLKVDVNGHGTSTVTSTFGDLNNARVDFRANLGAGDDTVTTNLNGNVLGTSNVRFNVHTGPGNDTVQFNAQGSTDPNNPTATASGVKIDTGASLAIDVDGGPGRDTLGVAYEGVLDGKLRLTVNGGPGNDSVTANVTADAGSTGRVYAVVRGGPGNDDLTLNVTDNSGGSGGTTGGTGGGTTGGGTSTLGSVFALLDGGPGRNTATHTPNVKVVHAHG